MTVEFDTSNISLNGQIVYTLSETNSTGDIY